MKKPIDKFLKVIINFLDKEEIKYAVIGGIAVLMYGEPRLTEDIDINIVLKKEKIREFIKKLKKSGFSPALPNAEKIAESSGYLPLNFNAGRDTGKFDIIIAENPIEYAAIERAKTKKTGTVKTRIISPEDLVIHKIVSTREKDRSDLKGILLRQKDKLDLGYIRNWLRKIDKVEKNNNFTRTFHNMVK